MSEKILYSFQASLLFFIIASPFMYNFTNKLLKSIVQVNLNGSPTLNGLILHSIVFGLIVYLLMLLQDKKDNEKKI